MKIEKISMGGEKRWGSGAVRLATQIFSLPILVGSCAILTTLWLWQTVKIQEQTQIESKVQRNVQLAAETLKNDVQAELKVPLVGLGQMANRWQSQGKPTRREWKAASQAYMDFYPNCQILQWVDTSFGPRWTVSKEGIAEPDREFHQKMLAAYDGKGQEVIVVPSIGPERSKELWVYVPLVYEGRKYGFFVAAYSREGLLKTIFNKDIVPQYGLSVFDGNTEILSRNKADRQNGEAWQQEINFTVDGMALRSRIWPSSQLLTKERSQLPDLVLGTGLLLSVALTLTLHSIQTAQRRKKEAEVANFTLYQQMSDRERAEEALQQYVQMMDLANEAIVIRDLDDLIIYWNSGAERLYGWKKQEVVGKYVHTFLKTIFPQPLEKVLEICLREGHWQGELIDTKRDGRQISVASSWTLLRDKNGNLSSILEINKDISERKQILQALQQSEERFRCAVFYAPFPSIIHAEDGEIVAINQSWTELSGYNHSDIPTMADWIEKAYREKKELIKADIDRLYNINSQLEQGEYVITTSNGSQRTWVFSSVPLGKLPDGRRLVMSMAVDITSSKQVQEVLQQSEAQIRQKATELEAAFRELRDTQAQLIQSEKMSSLGQLVAGVAHEINNPVNFIFGNITHAREYTEDLLRLVQLYQDEYANPTDRIREEIEAIDLDFLIADLPKLLASMKVGAERIREIVQSLRHFSRLDEAERKEVDIHEGIDSTLMILQNRLKGRSDHPSIQVIKEYGKLPLVECYAGQLNQVFMNLLSNAIDALEDYNKKLTIEEIEANPSTITIRTSLGHGRCRIADREEQPSMLNSQFVVIRIADNGAGMTEEVRKQVFDPFFTTKPVGKGTGLGLSISYQIVVEKHRGKLECYSQPGLGAEFAIEIPLYQSNLK
ncbi:PAS domain S-box protein [Argonema antarcticum]|uniref:PAS domain S-box protein n=1 Tax=Argonema antarcticum TaxID=2942763 RepID=UPI002012E0A3|nr:PAS domain S-box protein [Argonema antarcticum]MCL1473875.1 PAS domain S-box protein [Argonema antarcticum A004/B2]